MQVSAASRQSLESSASNGPSPDEHIVKSGETLSGIAAERGVSLNALLVANPQIVNPNLIRTGQVVNLPPREEASGPALAGPAVRGLDHHAVSQHDADALLADLGL